MTATSDELAQRLIANAKRQQEMQKRANETARIIRAGSGENDGLTQSTSL